MGYQEPTVRPSAFTAEQREASERLRALDKERERLWEERTKMHALLPEHYGYAKPPVSAKDIRDQGVVLEVRYDGTEEWSQFGEDIHSVEAYLEALRWIEHPWKYAPQKPTAQFRLRYETFSPTAKSGHATCYYYG